MSQPIEHHAVVLGPEPRHQAAHQPKIEVEDLSFWYADAQALTHVSLTIFTHEVTAFMGPSGCGKSTLLRCFNRMNEMIPHTRMEGRVLLDGQDIYTPDIDPPLVRQRFGWIAQKPDPFPGSIRHNLVYGPQLRGLVETHADEDALVEKSLRAAGLWDEVKDRLEHEGFTLSIGQQQRLCIARAIAFEPDVLLMDEPCSALDPGATAQVEELINDMRERYTIVIITHNLQQAARIAQRIGFFHLGELVESGDAERILLEPKTDKCRAFVTGLYG